VKNALRIEATKVPLFTVRANLGCVWTRAFRRPMRTNAAQSFDIPCHGTIKAGVQRVPVLTW